MLIEFKVKNFRCFRDEVTLNLQPAGADKMLRGNIWKGNRYSALKSAAVFGPNASGKTSLLDALYVFAKFVRESATRMNAGDPIQGVAPFRLAGGRREAPSCFEVLLELDGAGYQYRVEASQDRVLRECLERQGPGNAERWLTLIDRGAAGHVSLHERLGTEARRAQIIEDTRDNALILSRAAERNVKLVEPLFTWFRQCVHHVNAGAGSPPAEMLLDSVARAAAEDPELLRKLTQLVRDADTGIVRMGTETVQAPADAVLLKEPEDLAPAQKKAVAKFNEALKRLAKVAQEVQAITGHRQPEQALRFFAEHRGALDKAVRFAAVDESAGTLQYLRLVGFLLRHCATADLLAVDELHASLHPQLARRVVQLAHSPEFGTAGAQLLFSTHDATLLDPSLLRRDQIVLAQKGPDGAAELYTLWDFEDTPRNTAAWARNYLAGRFGAVPVFGPALTDIPQAEEPTPVKRSAGEPVGAA